MSGRASFPAWALGWAATCAVAALAAAACSDSEVVANIGAPDASEDRVAPPADDARGDTMPPADDAALDGALPTDAADPLARCTVISLGALTPSGQPGILRRLSGQVLPNLGAPEIDASPQDRVHIDLRDLDAALGAPLDLASGANANYSTCAQCVRVYEDFAASTSGFTVARIYFQKSGTMRLDELAATPDSGARVTRVRGSLNNVVLVEVTHPDGGLSGASTEVVGGRCLLLPSAQLAVPADGGGQADAGDAAPPDAGPG